MAVDITCVLQCHALHHRLPGQDLLGNGLCVRSELKGQWERQPQQQKLMFIEHSVLTHVASSPGCCAYSSQTALNAVTRKCAPSDSCFHVGVPQFPFYCERETPGGSGKPVVRSLPCCSAVRCHGRKNVYCGNRQVLLIGFPQTGNLTLLPLPNFHWPGPYPHLCGLSHHSHILPSSDLALSVSCSTSFSCPILSSSQTPALPLTSPISWSRRIGETETERRCLMSATPY